ncbi:MAG: hypothetical protein ABSH14_04805 [Verrucomicrobiia bacterium]
MTGAEPYVAYSLKAAQRLARTAGGQTEQLRTLGGMTRIAGFVHDRETQDIILVGKTMEGLPQASLDDLVVALRARLVVKEWPTVSIDPTEETPTTDLLAVSFRGGIQDSQYGADFLDSDVVLKKYSLEALSPIQDVPTYKSLCLQAVKERLDSEGEKVVRVHALKRPSEALLGQEIQDEDAYQTRFWFMTADRCNLLVRDDVFLIKELRLVVQEQSRPMGQKGQAAQAKTGTLRDPGRHFANDFTTHLVEVIAVHPKLKRLKILFDLVAVGEGILEIKPPPDLTYLLQEYRVQPVRIRQQYEMIDLRYGMERSDGRLEAIRISGGIEFKTQVKWLNDGDLSALRKIVLTARPNRDALIWRLPLSGWKMPNADNLDSTIGAQTMETTASGSDGDTGEPGCSVSVQRFLLQSVDQSDNGSHRKFSGFPPPPPPPPLPAVLPRAEYRADGGVTLDMHVEETSFQKDSTGELDRIKEKARESRPDSNALSWPLDRKEGTK